MTHRTRRLNAATVLLLVGGATTLASCERKAEAVTPEQLQQRYGVAGAYTGEVPTSDGAVHGTLVPVTLADGRKAQLFVPQIAE